MMTPTASTCPPEVINLLETLLEAVAQTGRFRCAVVIFSTEANDQAEVLPGFSYMPRNANDKMLVTWPAEELMRLSMMLKVASIQAAPEDVEIHRTKVSTKH